VVNQSAFWSLHRYVYIRKDVSSISDLTRNDNGSYGTEERQRYNGTAQRNSRTERQNGNGRTTTEWWKLGITEGYFRKRLQVKDGAT